MTKRFGFTLAEVLITLGIIGVVAAMTIPTLISNTNGAKFRSQFKKTLSTLNQAGLMSQAQYDFDYAGAEQTCADAGGAGGEGGEGGGAGGSYATQKPDSVMSFCAILNGTLTGQTFQGTVGDIKRSITNDDGTAGTETYTLKNGTGSEGVLSSAGYANYIAYSLADGSLIAFNPEAASCELPVGVQMGEAWINGHKKCLGFIDVNGATLPNKEVTCSAVPEGGGTANKASFKVEKPCTVKNDAKHMTDVFPIVFHDATVEPASDASKYVLTSSK